MFRLMKDSHCVMITGHRDLAEQDKTLIQETLIQETIAQEVTNPKVDIIYFGGAVGADSLALETALTTRVGEKPKLVVVLPKTAKDQRSDLHNLTSKADEIIELKLSRKIYSDIWWEHDKWMVNNSQKCIAFWDGIEAGGTYNAMRYAQQQEKEIQHIKMIGRNNNG